MRTLNKQEIMDILIGCTILGTGGGGAPKEGIEAVERELAAGKLARFDLAGQALSGAFHFVWLRDDLFAGEWEDWMA